MKETTKIDPFYFCPNCQNELEPHNVTDNDNCKICGDKAKKLDIESVEGAKEYLRLLGVNINRI